jgi:hypothetical protein
MGIDKNIGLDFIIEHDIYEEQKNVSMKDGAFYSVGLGMTLFKKLQAEGAYSLSTGKADGDNLNLGRASIALRYNVF